MKNRLDHIVYPYSCPNCDIINEVTVYPILRGNYSGKPENCSPDEGGEVDPEECESCGTPFNTEEIYRLAMKKRLEDARNMEEKDEDDYY